MHPSHPDPRLHGCEDLSKLDTPANDQGCLQVLQRYHASALGSGTHHAPVVSVAHKIALAADNAVPLAVKIITNNKEEAVREITNACFVNDAIASAQWENTETYAADRNPNRIFCKTFGYIKCGGPPPAEWRQAIGRLNYASHKTNWYLIMEHVDVGGATLERAPMQLDVLISFTFELFFALAVAYDATRFRHKDLHLENVMSAPPPIFESPIPSRIYSVADISFEILSAWYPKIIDFGKVTFDESRVVETYDVQYFLIALRAKYLRVPAVDKWIGDLLKVARRPGATFVHVLHAEAFESLRVEHPPAPKALKSMECHVCGHIATRAYEHSPTYTFCEREECVERMAPIGNMLL